MRRACERRHDIFVKSYVADGEDALVAAHLKRRLDDDKSALVLLNVQLLNYWIDAHARRPDNACGFNVRLFAIMLDGETIFHDAADARLGVNFDVRLFQRVFNKGANLVAHAGHY